MKMLMNITFVILVITSLLISKDKEKIVTFQKSERFEQTNISKHYLSVIKEDNFKSTVELYTTKGDKLYEISNDYPRITNSKIIEDKNSLIVHYPGSESRNNAVVTYNLQSGKEKLIVRFDSQFIDISSTGNSFITSRAAFDNRNSPFKLFDLNNGQEVYTGIDLKYYVASWIDSIRFVVAHKSERSIKEIKNKSAYNEFQELIKQRRKVKKEKNEIKIREINDRLKELQKIEPLVSPIGRRKTTSLLIYNVVTGEIEVEKSIYDKNGNKTSWSDIKSDNKGNIYLLYKNQKNMRSAMKLNSNLETIWDKSGNNYTSFRMIYYNESIIITTSHATGSWIIDDETGNSIPTDIFKQNNPKFSEINFDELVKSSDLFLSNSSVEVDYKNQSIKFLRSDNE